MVIQSPTASLYVVTFTKSAATAVFRFRCQCDQLFARDLGARLGGDVSGPHTRGGLDRSGFHCLRWLDFCPILCVGACDVAIPHVNPECHTTQPKGTPRDHHHGASNRRPLPPSPREFWRWRQRQRIGQVRQPSSAVARARYGLTLTVRIPALRRYRHLERCKQGWQDVARECIHSIDSLRCVIASCRSHVILLAVDGFQLAVADRRPREDNRYHGPVVDLTVYIAGTSEQQVQEAVNAHAQIGRLQRQAPRPTLPDHPAGGAPYSGAAPVAGTHFMQVSKRLGHGSFTLTLDTYGDWIPEGDGGEVTLCLSEY